MENMNYAAAQQTRQSADTCAASPAGSMFGEAAYVGNSKRLIGFSFGDALQRVKEGCRMSRHGWNGSGQFVFIVYGSDPSHPEERASLLSGVKSSLFAFGDQGTSRRLPHVALHNTRGESVPWAPSQSDMLAEDWYPV